MILELASNNKLSSRGSLSFLDDKNIEIIGVEAGGKGIETNKHAASLSGGRPGVLHGNKTYLLQDFT